ADVIERELTTGGVCAGLSGSQGQVTLGYVVAPHALLAIPTRRSSDVVPGDQRRSRAVGQREVRGAVGLVLPRVRRDGDGQLLDLDLHPAGQDDGDGGAQGDVALVDDGEPNASARLMRGGPPVAVRG